MMRWVIFSIAVVALAATATVVSTFVGTSSPDVVIPTTQDKPTGPTGSISVDGPLTHKFGIMSQQADGTRDWTITNKGPGVVKLSLGQPSCSCTIAELSDGKTATLAAGESTKVTLNWNTKHFQDKYRQMAPIIVSNDPANQTIEFAVEGNVQPAVQTFPPDGSANFMTVSNDATPTREVIVFSKDRPDLKVSPPEPTEAALFDTKVVPLTDEECKRMRLEKGQKLILTVRPTAPLGAFNEEIVVTTDHPKRPEMKVKALGKLVGPITLTPDRVEMLQVPAKAGETRLLTMWVRGRKGTKFTIDKKPKDFVIEISPKDDAGSNNATKYQVSIKVPAGLASGTSVIDEIILKTDHPRAAEVKIPVTVLVHAG